MGVKHSTGHLAVEIRNHKYETIWKFKVLNFQNRDFGWGGPKSELLKKQPSIIRATCAFDAKKVVPGMKISELTRCQKRSKKNFAFFNFYLWVPAHLVENRAVRYPRSFVESALALHQSGVSSTKRASAGAVLARDNWCGTRLR